MQRVEILVWRDFVKSLRESPGLSAWQLAKMHGINYNVAEKWLTVYNKQLSFELKEKQLNEQ